MVREYVAQDPNSLFSIGEYVDCKDENDKWLNAEILEITTDKLRVHFTSFSKKFDRWVLINSENVLKQWRRGQKVQLFNRIDVLDTYNK